VSHSASQRELQETLNRLLASREGPLVEFKEAKRQFDEDKLGRYFTALANEANLAGQEVAWIVLGVDNSRTIVGTDYLRGEKNERTLRDHIEQGTRPGSGFRGIHELLTHGRVLLLEVPSAPRGIPMSWKGHYYARDGETLVPLSLDKQDTIRRQKIDNDWTAVPVPGATIKDLDEKALAKARSEFAAKHPEVADDIANWGTEEFLERARLTRDGCITRATILLLGTYAAGGKLNPHMAQITWHLVGQEEGYHHFTTPFLLNTTNLYQRIRNLEIKLLRPATLIAETVHKYDRWVVLEAIHNALAHQDYTSRARIIVTEYVDRLEIVNRGSFFEGRPEDYVTTDKVPEDYRNPFLVEAMASVGMIETMGFGIRKMTTLQRNRFLPLPDYDLSDPTHVKFNLYGRVVDEAYTTVLMERSDLPLADILALDRVQKGLPINRVDRQRLRRQELIEGRSPQLFVSAKIAQLAGSLASTQTRALSDTYFEKTILTYLSQHGSASRADLESLLWDKFGDGIDDKAAKLSNLLTKMRRRGRIRNVGSHAQAIWKAL
jgi:ATP-dependent DNA helicase RecG